MLSATATTSLRHDAIMWPQPAMENRRNRAGMAPPRPRGSVAQEPQDFAEKQLQEPGTCDRVNPVSYILRTSSH